jgi:probable DNA metabolism protein
LQAFSADEPDKEMTVYRFLVMLFKYGGKAKTMYNHPYIIAYNDMSHRVSYETHRFCGFLRFRELSYFELAGWKTEEKIYYAPYYPDNNITAFLMEYFVKRNQDMKMVIHDTKHNIFGIYDKQNWDVFVLNAPVVVEPSECENMLQRLWKQYYSTVTIESRTNRKLMNQFLPVRYRRFLNEFSYIKF